MALDPVTTRHKLLLTTISDELGSQGEEYDSFIEHMKGYVPRDLLKSKKTLLAKFDALASKGHLGPGKYDVLKKICEDSGNIDIQQLVEKAEADINKLLNAGTDTAVPSKQERTGRQENTDRLHYVDEEGHGYYDNSRKTGLLLILNSKSDREGTEKDLEQLSGFFGENGLRFHVFDPRDYGKEDLTTKQVDEVLSDVRTLLDSSLSPHYYCFICVILSHGNEKGINTNDGLKSVEDIRHFFSNKNMPNFEGRPKVFFIQACREKAKQKSQVKDFTDGEKRPEARRKYTKDEIDEIIHIPNDADTLLAYATTLGNKAFRRPGTGSWFITECINVFEKYHRKDHLEDMLITVRENVALHWKSHDGRKQMPCVWSTLTKRLKLT